MVYVLLHIIFSTLFMKHVSAVEAAFTVSREDVEINVGDSTCISNCSHISPEGDRPLVCSVEECKVLEIAGGGSQAPQVKKVYFEIYSDGTGREKLALHFEWSPVNKGSMERIKGYLLNISNGISTYSTCYSISTPTDFYLDTKDLFYNDCFGKAGGTMIKLDSKITVNITTLPLQDINRDDGKVMFVVEVPSCDRVELRGFSECAKPGGHATRLPCATNCSSYSTVNGVTHHISCTLSKSNVISIGGKEKCDSVAKDKSGIPSPPKHLKKAQEWYKYIDEHGNIKIALNFSWTPRVDSSLGSLHGYYLEIIQTSTTDLTYYNKCFSVHTNLTLLKHSKAEFFHDCYGRGSDEVLPGKGYHIHLDSWPSTGIEKENFEISIPDCSDPRVQDVTHCIQISKKLLTGSVDEIYCHNRSMKYNYHVSSHYGDFADIVLCEYGPRVCSKMLLRMENLSPKNTLYNISLLSSADLSRNYSIFVHGSGHGIERALSFPNFKKCVAKTTEVSQSTLLLILILIVGIFCLIAIVVLACCICRKECWRKFLLKYGRTGRNVTMAVDQEAIPVEPLQYLEATQPPIQTQIRVYVIFMQDHEYHTDVVHHFCSYLKEDLGLAVKVHIWKSHKVASNALNFMEDNLRKADKVIVICSEGTKNCLDKDEYDGDMFTPVVRNICQQSFVGRNPGKFLVCLFEYSDQSHVPELLIEQSVMYFSLFKVMKQFEQFYFRLTGVEQFEAGRIKRIEKIAFDRYYDPKLTKHGKNLKEAIDRMKRFVDNDPTWYNDLHGSYQPQPTAIPQPVQKAVDGSLVHDSSILEPIPTGASISRINAAPPPELLNEGTSTVQKVPNGDLQPCQMQPRRMGCSLQSSLSVESYPPFTSVSTESSYIIDEDLSLPASAVSCPTQDVFHSYHPDSFQEYDFSPVDENSTGRRLLSSENEITRIGLTPAMEKMREPNGMMFPFLTIEEGEDEVEPAGERSPESGVFTLAPVEDTDDVEEDIKKINKS